jgi:uncharacterized protein YodC (DUF2158 family)
MAFLVGDVVQPRYGGGPRMKVENSATSGGNERVTCVWGANNECHNHFAAELLQSARAKDEPTGTRTLARLRNSPTSWLRSGWWPAGRPMLATTKSPGISSVRATMRGHCDHILSAPSEETAVVQQIYLIAAHAICGVVERELFGRSGA